MQMAAFWLHPHMWQRERDKGREREISSSSFKATVLLDYGAVLMTLLNPTYLLKRGFCGGSAVKNAPVMQKPQEAQVRSLGWEDSLEEGLATHSSILTWRIPMDRGAWRATVHVVTKSWTRLKQLSMLTRTSQ